MFYKSVVQSHRMIQFGFVCSNESVRVWMSVVRFDRNSRWSQFAFPLNMSLESSTFFDVVHSVLLRCDVGIFRKVSISFSPLSRVYDVQ
jgi:hypothetical protein